MNDSVAIGGSASSGASHQSTFDLYHRIDPFRTLSSPVRQRMGRETKKAQGNLGWDNKFRFPSTPPGLIQGLRENGQGRTRTGDTRIFSAVLYQLSYLTALAWGRCFYPQAKQGA